MPDKVLSFGWHDSFGWLRRPDLDYDDRFAYEHPDGRIITSPDPAHKKRMHLTKFMEEDSGRRYVSATRNGDVKAWIWT